MIFFLLQHPLFINFATIIFLILLGIYLRWSRFITESRYHFLTSYTLNIVLPCFIISSFMTDMSKTMFTNGLSIFIWSIGIYSLFIIIAHFYYNNKKSLSSDDKIILKNILPIGGTAFFGMAVVSSLYNSSGVFAANVVNISVRIFLYTICFISISGSKFNKQQLSKLLSNPSLISTFIGITIFFLQDYTPQIIINNHQVSIFRLDYSLPFIFHAAQTLGSSLESLIWIIIGASITKKTILSAVKSKEALVFMIQKIIVLPFIGIIVYFLLEKFTNFYIDKTLLPSTLMLLVCPPANVLVAFSIRYKRSSELCIACFLTSTILALIAFPLYYLLFKFLISNQWI